MLQSLQEQIILGRPVLDWLYLAAIWTAATVALVILRRIALRYAGRIAKKTAFRVDDVIVELVRGLKFLFLVAVGLYVALRVQGFEIPGAGITLYIITLAQAVISASSAARIVADWYLDANPEDASQKTAVNALLLAGRLIAWVLAMILALDAAGVDITALVTGLGVGGIALALAVQNVLSDVLAYVSILLDRPFVNGDFLIVAEHMGTVEHIGIKSTRLRSLSGEELIFSNTDLLSARIRNYKGRWERRVVFSVGVLYSTPAEQLEVIPTLLREAVEAQEQVRFDRAHLKTFADSAVTYEVVFYVLVPEYIVYMDIQHAINLRIFREFAAREIEFAFPTRTIHVASTPEGTRLTSGGSSSSDAAPPELPAGGGATAPATPVE